MHQLTPDLFNDAAGARDDDLVRPVHPLMQKSMAHGPRALRPHLSIGCDDVQMHIICRRRIVCLPIRHAQCLSFCQSVRSRGLHADSFNCVVDHVTQYGCAAPVGTQLHQGNAQAARQARIQVGFASTVGRHGNIGSGKCHDPGATARTRAEQFDG